MKTKNLILLVTFLISGIIVNAQTYSDGRDQQTETKRAYIHSAEKTTPPDIIASFGTWWTLIKANTMIGIGIDLPNNGGTNNRDINPQQQEVRTLPRLPGPYRYRSSEIKGNALRK